MGESRLCMVCCCGFMEERFMDLRSAMITKSHFITFCKEMECVFAEKKADSSSGSDEHTQSWNVREKALLNGDLNLDYQKVSVCHDCLRHISGTNEMRGLMNEMEGQARALQEQLLKVLKELKGFVKQYYGKLKCIEGVLKTSDEPCLSAYIEEHLSTERGRDVINFRESIMNAVTNMSTYQQNLEQKTHCKTIIEKKGKKLHSKRRAMVHQHRIERVCVDGEQNTDSHADSLNQIEVKEDRKTSLSLRRSSRPRSTPNLKNVIEESESENEDHRWDGSTFSDSQDELLVKEETERSAEVTGMSDFKQKITNRVLKWRETQLRKCNESKKESKKMPKRRTGRRRRAVAFSYPDPLIKYPVEFDLKTQKLSVNETEIIFHENDNSLKCSLCDHVITERDAKAYRIERVMQDHIIGTHIRGYKCDVCGNILGRYKYYLVHMHEHSRRNEKPECNCDICGKPFKSEEGVKNHKWYHMNQEEMEDAIRCGNKAPPSRSYSSRIKSKPRDVPCPTCGKAFRTRREVKAHEARIHKIRERIMCQKCGKMLLPGPSMWYHDLTCTKRDTNRIYECFLCQKTYQNKFLLRQHERLFHSATSSDKPFVCSQCGRAFARKSLLDSHEVTHSEEKPFKCEGCTASFKWRKGLTRHQTTCKVFNFQSGNVTVDC